MDWEKSYRMVRNQPTWGFIDCVEGLFPRILGDPGKLSALFFFFFFFLLFSLSHATRLSCQGDNARDGTEYGSGD